MDDLNSDEETGAAHAGEMELGSGLFYGYTVVDVPLLVSNFSGCDRDQWREQEKDDVRIALIQLLTAIATVSPGAKLGSTAPYARAELVMLECGSAQPRSLANAYLNAIKFSKHQSPMQQSADVLLAYLGRMDGMYGNSGEQRVVTSTVETSDWTGVSVSDFSSATEQALDAVFGG